MTDGVRGALEGRHLGVGRAGILRSRQVRPEPGEPGPGVAPIRWAIGGDVFWLEAAARQAGLDLEMDEQLGIR